MAVLRLQLAETASKYGDWLWMHWIRFVLALNTTLILCILQFVMAFCYWLPSSQKLVEKLRCHFIYTEILYTCEAFAMLWFYAHHLLQTDCYSVYCFCAGFVEFIVVKCSFKVLCVSWTCKIKFSCTVQLTSSNEL